MLLKIKWNIKEITMLKQAAANHSAHGHLRPSSGAGAGSGPASHIFFFFSADGARPI
jgi:hypothetical protein